MNLNTKLNSNTDRVAQVFRHLRISRGMRTRDLAKLMACNNSLVTHYETGRNTLPSHRIKQLCKIFRLTDQELGDYLNGKPIPLNYRDECMLLIEKMTDSKLQTVYEILKTIHN